MDTQDPIIEEKKEAIRLALVDFENYVNAKKLDELMSLYFDDVIYMQHGFDDIVGHEQLKKQFANMFSKSQRVSLDIKEIDVSGDMGYARILTTNTLKPDTSGKSTILLLRVLEVWRLDSDNRWKLIRISVNNPTTR